MTEDNFEFKLGAIKGEYGLHITKEVFNETTEKDPFLCFHIVLVPVQRTLVKTFSFSFVQILLVFVFKQASVHFSVFPANILVK